MNSLKEITHNNRFWLVIVLLLILIGLAVVFIDQALFVFINRYLHHYSYKTSSLHGKGFFEIVSSGEVLFAGSILFLICIFVVTEKHKSILLRFIFFVYQLVSLLLLNEIKLLLKYVFARCSPEVCMYAIANYNDTYGFYWFTDGLKGFPSGHFVFATYCLFWSFILKNKINIFEKSFFCIILYGLVVYNFHFLGDCFAGMLVGLVYGAISAAVWITCFSVNRLNIR